MTWPIKTEFGALSPEERAKTAVAALKKADSIKEARKAMGASYSTFHFAVKKAVEMGLIAKEDVPDGRLPRHHSIPQLVQQGYRFAEIARACDVSIQRVSAVGSRLGIRGSDNHRDIPPDQRDRILADSLR